RLESLHRNPHWVYTLQDAVFYEKAYYEPNLELLLNCSCQDAEMDGDRIASVTGWQLTTETYHTVHAKVFADCSGDSILAPLTGAAYRVGREAASEFGETIAPEVADKRTMGMSILFMAREYDTPQPFEPPAWAYRFEDCDDLPFGEGGHKNFRFGYWWVELGGEHDSIHDTEELRHELQRIALGVWDHLKNYCKHRDEVANYALEWLQYLPGKRESRRYEGDHILTENDIMAEGRFDDTVAYGGWTMDDHHPAGFWSVRTGEPATIWHPCPSPYGIPYRILYSRNVDNLMFAGRNVSASHAAMSSTRVMATCAVMGQAVGTAAAIAVRDGIKPREVGGHMHELQQTLLRDDCYLPWVQQEMSLLTMGATLEATQGDPEPVRDGFARQVGEDSHAWEAHPGDAITYTFEAPVDVASVTLTLDSDLSKRIAPPSKGARLNALSAIPPQMPKVYRIEGLVDGNWKVLHHEADGHQRFVRISVNRRLAGVRFALEETWGAEATRVYAFYVD
ncbi:MAG: FAD-dependent oxidoreductase, partial [Anaerolineae bacterium]